MTNEFQQLNASTFSKCYKSDDLHSSPKNRMTIYRKKRELFEKLEQLREEKQLRDDYEL